MIPEWMQYAFAVAAGLITLSIALRLIPDGIRAIRRNDEYQRLEVEKIVDDKLSVTERDIKAFIMQQITELKLNLAVANAESMTALTNQVAALNENMRNNNERLGTLEKQVQQSNG